MNGYILIRDWYNFKFANPSKAKAVHSDMYCYLVDLWNRLGQKSEFGLPTSVAMESLGIGSYNTYKKTLNDLIEFGFIRIVSESKNQHQSKIVALSKNDKAIDKALDEATIKASDKATDTIIEQKNNRTNECKTIPEFSEFLEYALMKKPRVNQQDVRLKYESWKENNWCINKNGKLQPILNWKSTLLNTLPYIKEIVINVQRQIID